MRTNDDILIVVRSIANTANTIGELDDLIIKEQDKARVYELENRRTQLIEILEQLAHDLKNRTNHN